MPKNNLTITDRIAAIQTELTDLYPLVEVKR